MARTQMTNMHVPLPEPVYARLRAEARRTRRPATDLAREAIDRWLTEQERVYVHEEIARYAAEVGGSPDDLDSELEAAAIDQLTGSRTPARDGQ